MPIESPFRTEKAKTEKTSEKGEDREGGREREM